MSDKKEELNNRLAVIQGILDEAFFTPLLKNDWLAFLFDQPGLLGLEDAEVFDLFVRGAIAAETIYPETARGRTPLAWLCSIEDQRPVLAQVLASLRYDRPFLFHRALLNMPAVTHAKLNPADFELAEDFLQKALEHPGGDIHQPLAHELETLYRRGLKAAGRDPENPGSDLSAAAEMVLARPAAMKARSDAELRLWLIRGEGLTDVDPEIAPAVFVEVWAQWVGAVLGTRPDLDILSRLHPKLRISSDQLTQFVRPSRKAGHVITAECPFCSQRATLKLGEEIKAISGCPHLVFVGTGDEVHLQQALQHFDLGKDFEDLLVSYYQSPGDLDLFATIINDLYEMFISQGRLEPRPVDCETAPQGFYYLMAYFAGPPPEKDTRH